MAAEHGLYAQVVKLRQKDLKYNAANKNKNESKFKFQAQSARSQHWFDINFDWLEFNFSTHEPDFYKKLFQINEKNKIQIRLKFLKFQSEIQNVWKNKVSQ